VSDRDQLELAESAVEAVSKEPLMLLPSVPMAVIAATLIKVAISAYSMAVAPVWSEAKVLKRSLMFI
jgi:hypothetical protein